jgi:DNA polymerase-3 subunit gamma/tau
MVSLSNEAGGQTLAEAEAARRETAFMDARSDPAVAAVLARFPGAKIIDVRIPDAPDVETADADLPAEPATDEEDDDS